MGDETYSFFCSACGIKLTVPVNLAGVEGPCPACGAQIKAPNHVTPEPAKPSPAQKPVPEPAKSSPSKETTAEPSAPVPSTEAAHPAAGTGQPKESSSETSGSKPAKEPAPVKPEPRHLPQRHNGIEAPVRKIADLEPARSRQRKSSTPPVSQDPYVRNLMRLGGLVVLLFVSGAIMYGVLKYSDQKDSMDVVHRIMAPFTNSKPGDKKPPTEAGNVGEKPAEPSPADASDAAEPAEKSGSSQSSGSSEVSDEPNSEANIPWRQAQEVLEKFLSAKSLAERLPLLETRTPQEELAAGCLGGPLPAVERIVPEFRETIPVENILDSYYTVHFQTENPSLRLQTILLRSRGGGPAKVVADPFLDTFGGRLAAYAAAPTDKDGTFQVVVYAVASCTNPKIPNRDKKLTLKLLAGDSPAEITRAYFSRQSRISEMLESEAYNLKYGSAKACTVLLRWNSEDNPDYPYLEALTIKDLGWNP